MVEQLLLDDQEEIVSIIDCDSDWQQQTDQFKTVDVAIDFSMPSVAVANMLKAFSMHVPIVVGTTGWIEQLGYVSDICEQMHGSLVYGSNFSVGANLFMQLNKTLAEYMNHQPHYSVAMEETHHQTKKDAPSGTAIRLAMDLLKCVSRYDHWELVTEEPERDPMSVPIKAHRVGQVPGTHSVKWYSSDDDIEIIHTAHSRRGFARGAIQAAYWLVKHPGIYNFEDIACSIGC